MLDFNPLVYLLASMKASVFRHGINLWPPFLLAGIHVTALSADYRHTRVELRQRPWNMNYVRSHFGGSLFAMTDPLAERVRKLGGRTLTSIGQISRLQRVLDNDAEYVEPGDMLAELCEDNRDLVSRLREAHNVCDQYNDTAGASLIENWIDETEKRAWFLFEASRHSDSTGH